MLYIYKSNNIPPNNIIRISNSNLNLLASEKKNFQNCNITKNSCIKLIKAVKKKETAEI